MSVVPKAVVISLDQFKLKLSPHTSDRNLCVIRLSRGKGLHFVIHDILPFPLHDNICFGIFKNERATPPYDAVWYVYILRGPPDGLMNAPPVDYAYSIGTPLEVKGDWKQSNIELWGSPLWADDTKEQHYSKQEAWRRYYDEETDGILTKCVKVTGSFKDVSVAAVSSDGVFIACNGSLLRLVRSKRHISHELILVSGAPRLSSVYAEGPRLCGVTKDGRVFESVDQGEMWSRKFLTSGKIYGSFFVTGDDDVDEYRHPLNKVFPMVTKWIAVLLGKKHLPIDLIVLNVLPFLFPNMLLKTIDWRGDPANFKKLRQH
jgi:hypothetical protein